MLYEEPVRRFIVFTFIDVKGHPSDNDIIKSAIMGDQTIYLSEIDRKSESDLE